MTRFAWYGPLPPARTDIANYSCRILSHLKRISHVTELDVDAIQTPFPTGQADASDIVERNCSDFLVYQIGNNPLFHSRALKLSRREPGIMVLHDRNVHDLLLGCYDRVADDTHTYEAIMGEYHGLPGLDAARQVVTGMTSVNDIATCYPLFEFVLNGSLGAVVHCPKFHKEIKRRMPFLPSIFLPLPYPRPDLPAPFIDRDAAQPMRLLTFGFMNPNRRLMEILAAIAHTECKEMIELDVAGEFHDPSALAEAIERHGLTGRVRYHGFITDEDLDNLIRRSHLIVNLRNPTMGEASGSLLRTWAQARPSVITDAGWYADVPDNAAIKISAENEANDLVDVLEAAFSSHIDLKSIGLHGYQRLAEHCPAKYARHFIQWIEDNHSAMVDGWLRSRLISAVSNVQASFVPPHVATTLPACLTPHRAEDISCASS